MVVRSRVLLLLLPLPPAGDVWTSGWIFLRDRGPSSCDPASMCNHRNLPAVLQLLPPNRSSFASSSFSLSMTFLRFWPCVFCLSLTSSWSRLARSHRRPKMHKILRIMSRILFPVALRSRDSSSHHPGMYPRCLKIFWWKNWVSNCNSVHVGFLVFFSRNSRVNLANRIFRENPHIWVIDRGQNHNATYPRAQGSDSDTQRSKDPQFSQNKQQLTKSRKEKQFSHFSRLPSSSWQNLHAESGNWMFTELFSSDSVTLTIFFSHFCFYLTQSSNSVWLQA